jgi:hypothetical protein
MRIARRRAAGRNEASLPPLTCLRFDWAALACLPNILGPFLMRRPRRSVLPEVLKPTGRKRRIALRRNNRAVAEISLDRPRVSLASL